MRGWLLDYFLEKDICYVSQNDGKIRKFDIHEENDSTTPRPGKSVNFNRDEQEKVTSVLLNVSSSSHWQAEVKQNEALMQHYIQEKNYTLMDWVIKAFKNYVNFKGRAGRAEFWSFIVFYMIYSVIEAIVLFFVAYHSEGVNLSIFVIFIMQAAIVMPSLAVCVRRLHDANLSGWWTLLCLLTIGFIIVLIMCCFKTYEHKNRWGYPAIIK